MTLPISEASVLCYFERIGFTGEDAGLEVSFFMQPYLLKAGHVQNMISTLDVSSKTGFAVILNEKAKLKFWVGAVNAGKSLLLV
jgi:hypothetical protein